MPELICTKAVTPAFISEWEREGIQLRVYPFIQTRPLPFYINLEKTPDIWVFTSSRAVEAIKVYLKKYFLAILRSKKIVAIGHKTADTLGAMGYPIAARGDNALALVEEINEQFYPQQVLHFCGDRRRDELSKMLEILGFYLTEKIVYQTILTPQKVDWGQAEGALFFSPSAVSSYLKANTWPAGKLAFAIGPTTHGALEDAGIGPAYTAPEPNPEALLQTVLAINDISLNHP